MTPDLIFDEVVALLLVNFPDVQLEQDNEGQLVAYLGLYWDAESVSWKARVESA